MNRPYNPELLSELTQRMRDNDSPVISPPGPPNPNIVHQPGFEHYPSRIEAAIIATGGLARIFSEDGRRERAEDRAERLQHRINVVRVVGELIDNPRGQHRDDLAAAREKIGWVGTHKRELGGRWRAEDHENLGYQLFRKGPPTAEPFPFRPATRSEESASNRLESKREKIRSARNNARWLSESYKESLHAGHHRLSRAEQRHMSKISHKISRLDGRADRAQAKFDRITGSNDLRGKLARKRLERARTWEERKDNRRERVYSAARKAGRAFGRVKAKLPTRH